MTPHQYCSLWPFGSLTRGFRAERCRTLPVTCRRRAPPGDGFAAARWPSLAGLAVLAAAPLAAGVPADTTPAPTTCPSGQTAATVTQPPPRRESRRRSRTRASPPAPTAAPSRRSAWSPRPPRSPRPRSRRPTPSAGPKLAATGVIVDKPDVGPGAAGGHRGVLPHRRHGHGAGPRREEPPRLAAPGQHPQDPDVPGRHAGACRRAPSSSPPTTR